MNKLSAANVVDLLDRAAAEIRALNEKVASLEADAAERQQTERAEMLLSTMENRNLAGRIEGTTRQEKIASLKNRNLDVVEQALDLRPESNGLFDLSDRPGNAGVSAAEARLMAELTTT